MDALDGTGGIGERRAIYSGKNSLNRGHGSAQVQAHQQRDAGGGDAESYNGEMAMARGLARV